MNKILRIQIAVNWHGVYKTNNSWDCKETKSLYVATKVIGDYTIVRKIKKDDILKIDTVVADGNPVIEYSMWTFPAYESEGFEILIDAAHAEILKRKQHIDQMISHLNVPDEVKIVDCYQELKEFMWKRRTSGRTGDWDWAWHEEIWKKMDELETKYGVSDKFPISHAKLRKDWEGTTRNI